MMLNLEISFEKEGFLLDLNFQIDHSIVGLFGPSGAGKSTFLSLLAGLESPDSGRIQVEGETLFDGEGKINIPPHKRKLGLVFQEGRLFPHFSVEKNLRFGQKWAESNHFEFNTIVELLELEPLLEKKTFQISGGEKQRVAASSNFLSTSSTDNLTDLTSKGNAITPEASAAPFQVNDR